MDKDYIILGKLVFTLSIILHSAVNTIILERMIESLLDFIVAIKNHTEP